MKTQHITPIIVVFLLASAFAASKESAFINQLKAQLFSYLKVNNEEKVYVQTDKTIYKPGEYIWFNAFLTDASSGKPSGISNIVYVELFDPKGNLAKRSKIHVQQGMAGGEMYIEDSRPGGLYKLKAYTSWMKNFGEDRYFEKDLQVQQVITPRLLLKPDFEKKAYGTGDEVKATLLVTDLNNQKANHATVNVKVNLEGKRFKEFTVYTDPDGKAEINFLLPKDLHTPDGLLQAIVLYQGVEESVSRSIPIVLNKIRLKFYPEGGTWTSGISSRMAFEAINEFGKGADVSGEIIDEQGQKITSFDSFHFGMGAFEIHPEAGKRYAARILKPAGTDSLFYLPDATLQTWSLNLNQQTAAGISWNIFAPENGNAYLVAQVNGILYDAKDLSLKEGINKISFDTRQLPAGVAVFTLFNALEKPVCERLIMVNPEKRLHISIRTDKEKYSPGEPVKVEINTADEKGKPVPASLSLGVVDEQILALADDKQDNILSYLLLTSDLKGKIYEPSFYFDDKEKKSREAIDYLLLTHGWRRFNWDDVAYSTRKNNIDPENIGHIYGQVFDQDQKPVRSEVTLIELGHKKRVLHLTTRENGQFAFINVDPASSIALFAPWPNQIKVTTERPVFFESRTKILDNDIMNLLQTEDMMEIREERIEPNDLRRKIVKEEINDNKVMIVQAQEELIEQWMIGNNECALNEVVVVAYGTEKKSMLTGSVTTVQRDEIRGIGDISAVLSGRVAGVVVSEENINAGNAPGIRIRGIASLGNQGSEPLVVIDGIPMPSRGNNISPLSLVNLSDISSVSILKGAEASSIFGSRAANGVIVLTTKNRWGFPYHTKRTYENPAYTSVVLNATPSMSVSRSYYELAPRSETVEGIRSDFRTTVYWKNNVTTNALGVARVEFYNNEATSAFRITAEGISGSGLTGRSEYTYSTRLPLSLDAKLPNYLSFGDTLQIPVSIRNNTGQEMQPEIRINLSTGLRILGTTMYKPSIRPNTSEKVLFTVVSTGNANHHPIEIEMKDGKFSDRIKHQLHVCPIGFPRSFSFSGRDASQSANLSIRDIEPGSLQGTATVHISILDELFAGAESILREPYGCFEQTSSATFPNIFVMQLMNATAQGDDALRKKAVNLIQKGYDRLMSYEIKSGGFEWFGNPPANEALTAYGLVEFHEMNKVYEGVSAEMINRTKEFLLSRRNPDGTFIQSRGKYDHLSSAPYAVNCAYVVYALSETGTTGFNKAYDYSLNEAIKSKDMYRMALMSLAARNLGKQEDCIQMSNEFLKFLGNSKNFDNLSIESTIVNSHGKSAVVETVSLWAVSLMREKNPDWASIEKCIGFIVSNRGSYGYGSTQSTSLALKALTDYAIKGSSGKSPGVMTLQVNDTEYALPFHENTRGSIVNETFVNSIRSGLNTLSIRFDKNESILPYSVILRWNAATPESSEKCPLKLSVSLSQKKIKQNETVRLSVQLRNKEQGQGQPMSMAVIGIPAGLSPQPWQLKELQEKGVFDFCEILGNRLAVYYRYLKEGETKSLNLDLKADIPGKYIGAASSGYLYYFQENRNWQKGIEVEIVGE